MHARPAVSTWTRGEPEPPLERALDAAQALRLLRAAPTTVTRRMRPVVVTTHASVRAHASKR